MNTSRNNDRWDSLSMKEKSDMMKVAVQQGIYNLSEIRKAYNEYAEGGDTYDGTTESTQQMHRPYILTESETAPRAGYTPWGMTVAADTSKLNENELGLTLPEINVGLENYNINEKINEAQNKAGEVGAAVLGTAPIAAGALSVPLATLTGLAGGYAGDYLGGKAGSYFGENGELWGRVLGGLAGGMAGGFVGGNYLDPVFNKYLERININSKQSLGNSTDKAFVDTNSDNAAYSISSDGYNTEFNNIDYSNDKFKELFRKYAVDEQTAEPLTYKRILDKQIQQDVQNTINRGDPIDAFYKALDMDKRFKFIPSSKFFDYDIYNMSIGEVESMFGPEGVTLKNMLDIAKAHNFEGKYGELAKKWEAELRNLFPISKEDPDIALGIERTKNLYSIPEYRQRFNKVAGTLGDTFVEDALDRLANVKLQGVQDMPIGKHGLKPSGSAHPNSLDPRHSLIKIQNTDSSTGLQNVVQHETGHITHGTEVLEPAWMKRHNESIKPKLKPRFQNSDDGTIKYQNRLDEIIARSKSAVEYADRIRKPGESLEDALDRVYELGKNTQSGASGDIKDLVWYFDKESLLNFWKNFVGGYAAPVAIGGTAAATYANQQGLGGPLVQLANKYEEGGPTDESNNIVDWIIGEEGFNSKPENIGDGKITLGSGLTNSKWHSLYNKKGVWTEEDNRKAVAEEVENRRRWAEQNVPNWSELPADSQNALLSYKYNYNFTPKNSPKLFKALEDRNYEEAARQMDATSSNPRFKKGLQARRQREQEMFMRGINNMNAPESEVVEEIPQEKSIYTPPQRVLDNMAAHNGKYMIMGNPPLAGVRNTVLDALRRLKALNLFVEGGPLVDLANRTL